MSTFDEELVEVAELCDEGFRHAGNPWAQLQFNSIRNKLGAVQRSALDRQRVSELLDNLEKAGKTRMVRQDEFARMVREGLGL